MGGTASLPLSFPTADGGHVAVIKSKKQIRDYVERNTSVRNLLMADVHLRAIIRGKKGPKPARASQGDWEERISHSLLHDFLSNGNTVAFGFNSDGSLIGAVAGNLNKRTNSQCIEGTAWSCDVQHEKKTRMWLDTLNQLRLEGKLRTTADVLPECEPYLATHIGYKRQKTQPVEKFVRMTQKLTRLGCCPHTRVLVPLCALIKRQRACQAASANTDIASLVLKLAELPPCVFSRLIGFM
jgi:hypothetical protein